MREETAASGHTWKEGPRLQWNSSLPESDWVFGGSRWRSPVRILHLAKKSGLFQPPLLPYLTLPGLPAWRKAVLTPTSNHRIWSEFYSVTAPMDFKGGLRAHPTKRGRNTRENFLGEKVVTTTCTPFGCVIITNLNSEMATGMNRISLVF